MYNFDTLYDRRNTNSLKYDFATERGKNGDLLPLWVADMDFRAPEEVISAIKQKAEHGIFGYSEPKPDYFESICKWLKRRQGWIADPDKFIVTCGVVFSICALLNAVTSEGDGVIINQPVYYPFAESIVENSRKLVISDLINDGGYYTVDFDDFEKKIVQNKVKAFILCNPHNPVGRVWKREELLKLGEICLKHGVFVISDEIHSDFVFEQNRHVAFASLGEEFARGCAVCTAPTKTFNLAGLHVANTYIKDDIVREQFKKVLGKWGFSQPNVTGLVACKAAYDYGENWLEELKQYLMRNFQLMREYVAVNMSNVKFRIPEGTYLAWLDLRETGLDYIRQNALIEQKAKLWLDGGEVFGESGKGFQRINAACPQSVLQNALSRLSYALKL